MYSFFSAIHVDFALPPGKLAYEVLESDSSMEVCLVLANVGSFDLTSSLDIPVFVHLSTVPTGHTFYEQGQYSSNCMNM